MKVTFSDETDFVLKIYIGIDDTSYCLIFSKISNLLPINLTNLKTWQNDMVGYVDVNEFVNISLHLYMNNFVYDTCNCEFTL